MPPATHTSLAIRTLPHLDFVLGYNGVAATLPRVEGVVEIDSLPGQVIPVSHVSVGLYKREQAEPPSATIKFGSSRQMVNTVIDRELVLWQAPRDGGGRAIAEVYRMRLPFCLPLPTEKPLPCSLLYPGGLCETTYTVQATVYHTQTDFRSTSVPVWIERYDLLSAWGMFNVPKSVSVFSSDHIVEMELSVPKTCCGPQDLVSVFVQLRPNPDWPSKSGKVRVKEFVLQLEEVISWHRERGADVTRREKLMKLEVDMNDARLPTEGITRELTTPYPGKDNRESANYGCLRKGQTRIYSPVTGYTSDSDMYKIEYFIVVKAALHKAKDISASVPLVVCPMDRTESALEIRRIEDAVAETRTLFPDKKLTPGLKPGAQVVTANDHLPGWKGEGSERTGKTVLLD